MRAIPKAQDKSNKIEAIISMKSFFIRCPSLSSPLSAAACKAALHLKISYGILWFLCNFWVHSFS